MSKTAHHLFSGSSSKVYIAFQCFCVSYLKSVECSSLGELSTLESLSRFLWCSAGVVHHGPGLRPGRAGLLDTPGLSSLAHAVPDSGTCPSLPVQIPFWSPLLLVFLREQTFSGSPVLDAMRTEMTKFSFHPASALGILLCLNSKDINDVSVASKLSFRKNPSHLIFLCYLQDLSLVFLQGLSNQEIWSLGVCVCIFAAPITCYANEMGGAYQGAADGSMDGIDGLVMDELMDGWNIAERHGKEQ